MRKAMFALGLLAAFALVAACSGDRSSSGGSGTATAPGSGGPSAPAASCGGSGKG